MDEDKKKIWEYIFLGIGLFLVLLSIIIAYASLGSKGGLTTSLLLLGLFIAFAPYIVLEYTSYIKIKKAEENFPKFLRDYSEAINSGMHFTQAFDFVLKNDYSTLNEFLRRGVYRLSIGVTFPKVLEMMRRELKYSRTISNSLGIIINAYTSGGDIGTTMSSLSESIMGIREVYAERANVLHQQVVIMYVIFFVFLLIIFALYYVLVPLNKISSMDLGNIHIGSVNYCNPPGNTDIHNVNPFCKIGFIFGYSPFEKLTYFKILFLFLALVEAISIGVIAGMLSDGTLKASLKHIGILVLITLLSFIIGINWISIIL